MTPHICVIVPTIREYDCVRSYLDNARSNGFDPDRLHFLLVTEDFCETEKMASMLADEGVSGEVYDGSRRDAWFESHGITGYSHLIPSASHAETSFGLLYMWANSFDLGVFLDDDTRPHPDHDFFGTHLRNLFTTGEVECVRSNEQWVNVLFENRADHGLYPRGYPYRAMDETVDRSTAIVEDVVASQGLWTNVPDLDAVRILMDGDLQGQAETRLTPEDYDTQFVADRGQYLTVCSMNLAFRREVIPAFYQLPMDDNDWDVGRFDDIWSGVILKRACDVLDKDIINGRPLCQHNKAPRSTFDDLQNEVAGLELNEHLWKIVDTADGDTRSYSGVFRAIADDLVRGDWTEFNNGAFLNHCGEYMLDWLECLEALAPESVQTRVVTADD